MFLDLLDKSLGCVLTIVAFVLLAMAIFIGLTFAFS